MQDREQNSSAPALSVLMCVYNGASFVSLAIESILKQTFRDFEFIIVDDASSDTTSQILGDFAARDSRIKIVKNTINFGLTKSLNRGLVHCTGKYIARMDADDISRKDRFATQYAYMEERPDLVACGSAVQIIDEMGKILGEKHLAVVYEEIRKKMLFNNQFIHSTLFFRRDILQRVGGYDESFCKSQDYELMFRLSSRRQVENIDDTLVFFRTHKNSLSWVGTGQQRDAIRARWYAISKYGFPFFLGLFHIVLRYVWLLLPRSAKLWYQKNKIEGSMLASPQGKNILGIFFTYGVGLETFEKTGVLSRELMLYRSFLSKFDALYLFTYGVEDAALVERLREDKIFVIGKKQGWSNWAYSLCFPFLRKDYLKQCLVYKTNQMFGSWIAVFSSLLYKVPLIVRSGFILHTNMRHKDIFSRFLGICIERFALFFADQVIVTTAADKAVYDPYNSNICVIPNFVDTGSFLPRDFSTLLSEEKVQLLYVGRLSNEKNLSNLIFAIKEMPQLVLTLVGEGEERVNLQSLAAGSLSEIIFLGKVAYTELPNYFARADIFVLPSFYEGHPKVILEAMAAGVPIVASDVRGINTLLTHQKTGYLVGTGFEDIRKGIDALLADPESAREMAKHARLFVEREYSFEQIVEKEKALYEKYL
jgi:glycosyltransferase involved in cell wall biosynthesis